MVNPSAPGESNRRIIQIGENVAQVSGSYGARKRFLERRRGSEADFRLFDQSLIDDLGQFLWQFRPMLANGDGIGFEHRDPRVYALGEIAREFIREHIVKR